MIHQPITAEKPLLNPALRAFWTAKRNEKGERVRQRVLYGGRSSSKTWDAAGFAIHLAQTYRLKFLCTRKFQVRIEDSVYTTLKNAIDRFVLAGQTTLGEWQILENKIRHRKTGSEFIFYGLWRHIKEIKGLDGIDICWIEEAEGLTEVEWDILRPTLRADFSQFWIIWNPQLATDFVWQRFVERPLAGTLARQINYDENPFLTETMRQVIADDRADDPEEFEHIYLGKPRSDDDDAIIKRSWVMAAIGAHARLGIDPAGWRRIGFDVADKGKDKCAMIAAYGQLATWSDQWKAGEHELLKSSKRAWNEAVARDALLIYDDIGVGAQVGAKVNELNQADEYGRPSGRTVRHVGFNAGAAVYRPDAIYQRTRKTNKDMFANLKAQTWWAVADGLRNTFTAIEALNAIEKAIAEGTTPPPMPQIDPADMIFIDPDMPNLMQLVGELSTPKRDFDNAGRVKVESKADLAKPNREGGPIPSPNLADAFVMAFAPGQRPMAISAAALEEAF